MDPFTQRMLERARMRQEKCKQTARNPQELAKKQSPLKENNHTLKIKGEVEFTVSAIKTNENGFNVEITPTKIESCTINSAHEDEHCKENAGVFTKGSESSSTIREQVRSRLKRLGALYADSQLSSPIHQTEDRFSEEQDKETMLEEMPPSKQPPIIKSGRSVAKLAALANSMRQWEDDLSHPSIVASSNGKTLDKKHNESHEATNDTQNIHQQQDTATAILQEFKSANMLATKDKRPKKVEWDKTIIETLEAQGFSRTESKSRLVYDYAKHSSQDPTLYQDQAFKQEHSPIKECNEVGFSLQSFKMAKDNGQDSKGVISPIKGNILKGTGSPRTPPAPKMGLQVISPCQSPKAGSVLHKAALFESNGSANLVAKKNPIKDPLELTISERKALFEQNKGQALIPKAAFSMPVPQKYLQEKELNKRKPSPEKESKSIESVLPGPPKDELPQEPADPSVRTGVSKTLAKLFEIGAVANASTTSNNLVQNDKSARYKEIKMLANRWNMNKTLAGNDAETLEDSKQEVVSVHFESPQIKKPAVASYNDSEALFQTSAVPPPPFLMPELNTKAVHHPKVPSPLKEQKPRQPAGNSGTSGAQLQATQPSQKYPGVGEIKCIKVSPPKPGYLYPCLSDIEVTSETELETQDENNGNSSSDTNKIGDTSFGREILQATGLQHSPLSRGIRDATVSSDESYSENAVFEDMDDFLDEALSDDSDSDAPTPPKKTRSTSKIPKETNEHNGNERDSSSSSQSHSFKYTKGTGTSGAPTHVVEGNEPVPLMHTVSFYRRQQNMAVLSNTVRHVVRETEAQAMEAPRNVNAVSEESIRNKISDLLEEVTKQQIVISQASQALNLCCSTVEFSGSTEQVEGERLLLVATHKRQAALNEIQRLKVEGSLKPGEINSELMDRGSLVISNITLPLKRDYLRSMAADETCYHFVCLVRAQEQVVATPAVAASSDNLRSGGGISVVFPGSLRLDGLYSDFKATMEIYNLWTQKEVLPHDVKYHISNKKDNSSSSSKLRLTPKKILKQESKLIMPSIQSPAGPSAVRSTAFQMSGFVVFSLRELRRTQFTLNKVAFTSPLEGSISLQMSSQLQLEVTQRGFLTMFEDVSGFGAWHRRWCMLSGNILSYWKYPDDESKKVPIGQIDLNTCSNETVELVSRDICARPNTFLLETKRPSSPYDEDSLVLVKQGDYTIVRHLLSADTKEDRVLWCTQLHKALAMLRAWGSKNKC